MTDSIDRRAVLRAKAAGRLSRAPESGPIVAIEYDDIADAARGQMMRHARADDPAADHDDRRAFGKAHGGRRATS